MNLIDIKYLGTKQLNILKNNNINNIYDLLLCYPKKYEVYELQDFDLNSIKSMTVKGIILSIKKNEFTKVESFHFELKTGNYIIKVFCFNRSYLFNMLSINQEVVVSGKYNKKTNSFNLEKIFLDSYINHIEPLYKLNDISDKYISRYIKQILSNKELNYKELLPKELLDKYNFLSSYDFLNKIHFPNTKEDIKEAYLKIKYIEALILYLIINNENIKYLNKEEKLKYDMSIVKNYINNLDYELTIDQKKAVNDIFSDYNKGIPTKRIVQADVGSGKTVVALISSLAVCQNYQVCYVAPTESLCHQVYNVFKNNIRNYNVEILTSSTQTKKKIEIINKLKTKEIDILISTHSVFNSNIEFNNLKLIIIDEEQRFGLNQKHILLKNNPNSYLIFLSATPIPNTLAKTFLNDYEISSIKTKPIGRKLINTNILSFNEEEKLYKKITEVINNKNQVYIICPLIDNNNSTNQINVLELYEKYKQKFLGICNVDFIHSKLKSKEKEEKLQNFYQNNTQILISTTVVEVGIDNKNATLIAIYNSERFGLSTLHQLRGRVGRNSLDSYCYFITDDTNNERLQMLKKSSDCFELSEFDLGFRGPGEFLGLKQSGKDDFKYINFFKDLNILRQAKEDGKYILNNNLLETEEYKYLLSKIKNLKDKYI